MNATCSICLEPLPSQASRTPCNHIFCTKCLRRHLQIIATRRPVYPLPCPQCRQPLPPPFCLDIMRNTSHFSHIEKLILERAFHSNLRYCSNVNCNAPIDLHICHDRTDFTCPLCKMPSCLLCNTPSHVGRCPENPVADLAKQQGWKRCPKCHAFVEKPPHDCNYVQCLCSHAFCYKCGKSYRSTQPNLRNRHGRPGCTCNLFDVPREVQMPNPQPPVQGMPQNIPQQHAPQLQPPRVEILVQPNQPLLQYWVEPHPAFQMAHGMWQPPQHHQPPRALPVQVHVNPQPRPRPVQPPREKNVLPIEDPAAQGKSVNGQNGGHEIQRMENKMPGERIPNVTHRRKAVKTAGASSAVGTFEGSRVAKKGVSVARNLRGTKEIREGSSNNRDVTMAERGMEVVGRKGENTAANDSIRVPHRKVFAIVDVDDGRVVGHVRGDAKGKIRIVGGDKDRVVG